MAEDIQSPQGLSADNLGSALLSDFCMGRIGIRELQARWPGSTPAPRLPLQEEENK